jgi:putative redox protein
MVTASIGREHYRTELFTNGHPLIADEPDEVGGKNLGPGPGEFLMVSLASCTAITVRMYADRKLWPLEKIRVEVMSDKIDRTTIFIRHVYLEGALNDGQRNRLLQIANTCPVHKVLTNPIEIKTELR